MNRYVFAQAPRRVYWELTLACVHCRAEAMRARACDELDTDECRRVLDDLASMPGAPPHVIFTGGDPLKRPDLVELVQHAAHLGLPVAVAPSATPGLTVPVVRALKAAGVSAMSLSLDGPTPAKHDALRGVLGCFGWTLVAARRIVDAGIPLQINTLVTAETERNLEDTATVVARLGAARWSLFFLVAVGRARGLRPVSPDTCETTLRWLARHARDWPFVVSTTEAPHFRRIAIQAMHAAGQRREDIDADPAARGWGVRDGNGVLFIAANGDVTPSGFLPLAAGNVRRASPLTLYREAALFRSLREPDGFHGRCGVCEFRAVCGGSRARAWAATGDVLGEDPLCAWQPAVAY